jgi:hypothetical protein
MMAIARVQTIRGLAPNPDEIGDGDILEVDGELTSVPPPSLRMTVPPPSGTRYIPTGRYSKIVPKRRRTLRLIGDDE